MTSINIDAILTDTVRYQVAEWLETRQAKDYRGCEDGVGILDLGHFESTKCMMGGVTRGGIKGAEEEIYCTMCTLMRTNLTAYKQLDCTFN